MRRYARDAGPLLGRLNELTRCDCTTRNQSKARELGLRMDELERRLAELREREELDSLRPELDGVAVMGHLGILPGPTSAPRSSTCCRSAWTKGCSATEEIMRRLDALVGGRTGPG